MIRKAFITMLTVSAVAAGALALGAPTRMPFRAGIGDSALRSGQWFVNIENWEGVTRLSIGWRSDWEPLSQSYDAWKKQLGPLRGTCIPEETSDSFRVLRSHAIHRSRGSEISLISWVYFGSSRGQRMPPPPDREALATWIFGKAPTTWAISALWVLGVVLAAYPSCALMFGPVRRWRRRRRGLCVGCGYNLTGNVSGVCPECGRGR